MIPPCPSDRELKQYAIGDIDDALADEIDRHLADCPACEDTVAQFDSSGDTLMQQLPLAAVAVSQDSADPPGWLELLRTHPPQDLTGDDQDHEPPAGISNYELLGLVGRGGMGVVYRARHRQLNRIVALKVLRPRMQGAGEARRRFDREIQILGALHHPGIVMATDAGRAGAASYLVMELIDGVDLARAVRTAGPLPVPESCEIARQMADALSTAHSAGTVHRDVKPSNVMVDRTGRVKLLDFGLAHLAALSADSLETSLGRLLGTLDYMAPEQWEGGQSLDARADLYSLGATLFYLLTGRPPHGDHTGRSPLEQLRALASAEAPRVSSLRDDIPVDLDDFVAKLLSRDPQDRPGDAAELAEKLTKWAGGNLAEKVEAVCAAIETPPDDRTAVAQSLSELLGIDAPTPSPAAVPESSAGRGGIGRKLAWLAGFAGAIAAIIYGVTIFLKTPEGTLRIDSEVADVRIELVDEQNQAKQLRIDRGKNETTLNAGRYRIHFAGAHDGITIDKDVITLSDGKEAVARITKVPVDNEGGAAEVTESTTTTDKPERLYQGTTEREWRRRFEAETEPVAKLEGAQALLTLAADRPAEAQIKTIVAIGEEVVRAALGTDSIQLAFQHGDDPPIGIWLWSRNRKSEPYLTYLKYQSVLNKLADRLPRGLFAKAMCRALVDGDDPRAAFAATQLRRTVSGQGDADPAIASVVLDELDVPLTGLDRSALCLLIRVRYAKYATDVQRPGLFASFNELAVRLTDAPREGFAEMVNGDFRWVAATLDGVDWPATVRKSFARHYLRSIVEASKHNGYVSLPELPGAMIGKDSPWRGGGLPGGDSGSASGMSAYSATSAGITMFDAGSINDIRRIYDRFLDAWVGVANEYLEQHRDDPTDSSLLAVLIMTETVLMTYSDGDDWPVDKTAALISDWLRAYYTDDPNETTDKPLYEILPAWPAALLTQIVRIKGEIPEFVRNGHPRPKSVQQKLDSLKLLLSGKLKPEQRSRELEELPGLLDEAPYAVVKIINDDVPEGVSIVELFRAEVFKRAFSFQTKESEKSGQSRRAEVTPYYNNLQEPPTDPLLLLAILADLTGTSEAQDARIASLLADAAPEHLLRRDIKGLLSSKLKARLHARRMLETMAAKAKSPKLVEAIRQIDPHLPEAPTDSAAARKAQPKPVAGPERLYQGIAESEWQSRFKAETEPVAKLEAAQALLTLAAVRPPDESIDKILDIGEEVVRSAFGEQSFDFAFVDGSKPPKSTPHWKLIELGASYNAYTRFQSKLNDQIRGLPGNQLAQKLCRAVIKGNDARAAFAISLLRYAAVLPIASDSAAAQILFRDLDVPSTGIDRSAICLLIRAEYAQRPGTSASDEQKQQVTTAVNKLAQKLYRAPKTTFNNRMTEMLLNTACSHLMIESIWPAEAQKTFALLILDGIENGRYTARDRFPFFIDVPGATPPYDEKYVLQIRKHVSCFIGQWLRVANAFLTEHRESASSSDVRDVVHSLEMALLLYSDGDEWPVERTAEMLTEWLRRYYTDDPSATTDNQYYEILPDSPAALLTQVVRATGKIPEFARTGHPTSKPVREKLSRFKKILSGSGFTNAKQLQEDFDSLASLIDGAPYQFVEQCVRPNGLPVDALTRTGRVRDGRNSSTGARPEDVLIAATRVKDRWKYNWNRRQSIDPLLLLAILADLTGTSEAQDARIASLLADTAPEHLLRSHIKLLLAGKLKARIHARRMLETMASKTKSPELVETIRQIDPQLVKPAAKD